MLRLWHFSAIVLTALSMGLSFSMCLSRASRKRSKNCRMGVSSVSPENLKNDQGWLAASTEASAANSHSLTSFRSHGSVGISLLLSSPR
jgi:hypothetical protein